LDDAACNDVGLVVNEAMANVTRHAYGGATDRPVAVTAEALDDCGCVVPGGNPAAARAVRVTFRDWGTGVNPLSLPQRERDPLSPGGLGLICLRQLTDQVEFEPQPDGMRLVIVKRKK
jgi:anti-sigma regulatory factor (Ser/Thr protein kinase)